MHAVPYEQQATRETVMQFLRHRSKFDDDYFLLARQDCDLLGKIRLLHHLLQKRADTDQGLVRRGF